MPDATLQRAIPAHWILIAALIIAFGTSFYKYFIQQDYNYLVEAPCDTSLNECYVRDCTTEECPPNNLSTYSHYNISAEAFKYCKDNSCTNVCKTGPCKEIPCKSQKDIECKGPTMP